MGQKKSVQEHMHKLRQVYKGETEVFWDLQNSTITTPDALLAPPAFAAQFNIEQA